ncbi:MAG: hypothetical protein PUA84_03865, partial [Oscillospiraceae bacterium]|nr:hypothetical protein [Oscillospiraceae bacterium]
IIGISNPDSDIFLSARHKKIGTLNPDYDIILSTHQKSEFQIPISISCFHHGIKKESGFRLPILR